MILTCHTTDCGALQIPATGVAGLLDDPKQIALITGRNSDIAQPFQSLGASRQECLICLFIEHPHPLNSQPTWLKSDLCQKTFQNPSDN